MGDSVCDCSRLGNSAMLIINGDALGIILVKNCFSSLAHIVKRAIVISAKIVLQFYGNLKRLKKYKSI